MNEVERKLEEKYKVAKKSGSPYLLVMSRSVLLEFFAEMGFKKGAEIGVWEGAYSSEMCKTIPDLELICVDPWKVYSEIFRGSRKQMRRRYEKCVAALAPYNATIMNMTSLEAAKIIPDESLDFVYIDAAHDFDNVIQDIIAWNKKVKIGGIVSGHDYGHNFLYGYGVIPAVQAYTSAHGIFPYYVTSPQRKHLTIESWLWVKK
jgi:hypothetical protein